jgi:NAD(P)-dependent dehydrogenase (short-subunit alcohol dehydrogenase family)
MNRKVILSVGAALIAIAVPAVYLNQQASMSLSAVRAANAAASFAGRRAVVCGGTSGIGEGIAKRLAQAGFSVTIVGRSPERGAEIVEAMKGLGGSGHEFKGADLFLLSNAQRFAEEYAATHPSLDVLVLSQGMATLQGRTETPEGIDQKLALHFYGRMAFVEALLPLLRASPAPRVLSVLSGGVHAAYGHLEDDPELKTHYSLKNAADAAGFYNDLALDAYARQPENAKVTFVHAAPGFVRTRWGTEMPWIVRGLLSVIKPFAKSPADCAEFMCAPLLTEVPKRDAALLVLDSEARPAATTAAHTAAARDFMWRHVHEVLARVGVKPVAPGAAAGAGTAAGAGAGGTGAAGAAPVAAASDSTSS